MHIPTRQSFCLTACCLFILCWGVAFTSLSAQQTTVSTAAQWNGVDGFSSFGEPSDATFGQTFTVPGGVDRLGSFAFYIDDGNNPDAVDFQAFIMAWDGLKATGPVLYQSGALTTTNNGGLDGFERIQIIIQGGLAVTAGAQYVAFFSASNLFDGQSGDSQMGALIPGTYDGGGFVHLNNGANFSALTTNNWEQDFFFLDLAFEFVFFNSGSGDGSGGVAQPILVVDAEAIASALFSSVPTALAQRELALGASRTALRDFNGRLFRQRSGGASHSSSGSVAQAADVEDSEYHTVTVGEGDGDGKGTKVVYATRAPEARRWEVYSSFDYGSFDLDADRNFLGLRSDTYAGSVGLERTLSDHLLLGAGASWIESNSDQASDIEGITLAAYASTRWRGLYADLLYGATLLDHDIDRKTGLGSTVHAKPDSVTHTVAFNTGWNFHAGSWTTGPFAGVDYAHSRIDGYTEQGGSRAATEVSDQSIDSLISRLGWQASYRLQRSWGAITPQVRIGWERENLSSDDDLSVSLVNSPYYLIQGTTVRNTGAGFNAVVPGQDRERDSLSLGAGLLIEFGERLHLLLDYEGLLLTNGYSAHFAKLSLGWKF